MTISSAQIRLLKTGQRECKIDDDTWHQLLERETGVRSSKDLTDNNQVTRVLAVLEKLGFKNTSSRPKPRRRPAQPGGLITPPQQALIARQYEQLGYTSFAQRAGFNERCCGKQIPQTRTDGRKVIEGQKAILSRGHVQPAENSHL